MIPITMYEQYIINNTKPPIRITKRKGAQTIVSIATFMNTILGDPPMKVRSRNLKK